MKDVWVSPWRRFRKNWNQRNSTHLKLMMIFIPFFIVLYQRLFEIYLTRWSVKNQKTYWRTLSPNFIEIHQAILEISWLPITRKTLSKVDKWFFDRGAFLRSLALRKLSPREEELAERSKKGKSIVHFLKLT